MHLKKWKASKSTLSILSLNGSINWYQSGTKIEKRKYITI